MTEQLLETFRRKKQTNKTSKAVNVMTAAKWTKYWIESTNVF